jgi:outer membrane protein, heavy metal efflux system
MRSSVSAVCFAAFAVGCVPSSRSLYGPVDEAVFQRTGIRAGPRSAAVEQRVKELLGKPLDAEAAAWLAVLHSPTLRADYAELARAGGGVAASRQIANPELEAEILFQDGDRHLELAVVQDVTQLLGLLPRARGADAKLDAARRRAVARTITRATEARIALYRVAAAERVLERRRSIADGVVASADLARRVHAAGNLTNLDLARQELFEAQVGLEVADAEVAVKAARERLNALLGLTGAQTSWVVAPGGLPDPETAPSLLGLETEAVAASLDLEALRSDREAAAQGIGAARLKSFVPHLGLGAAAKQEGDGWAVGPLVSLSLPLWNWGQGERAIAWAELRGTQHRAQALAAEVRAAARTLGAELGVAHARAVALRTRLLPLRDRMLAESVLAYNAMNLSVFELLVARREAIATEVQYVDALLAYWTAAARVEQLRDGALPAGWGSEPARSASPTSTPTEEH